MKLRKTRLCCLLTAATLALALPVLAQTTQTATGSIVSSTPTQVVIRTDDGRRMTFAVDAKSTVPAGLTEGTAVTVSYHEMGGGTLHAAQVTTRGTGSTPSTTTRSETTTTTTSGTTTAAPPEPMPESSEPARTPARSRMPATASPLPLIGLAGLLSLSAGLALRAVRRSA